MQQIASSRLRRSLQGSQATTGAEQNKINQGIPLTAEQQQVAQAAQQQIEQFESSLQGKSNTEIKEIANKLEFVERKMLLKKVDQELRTIKETVVKPGDAATASATAASAAVVLNETPS